MNVNACIFDLDGTLIDSAKDIASSVNYLRGELGMSFLPLETIENYVGDGLANLLMRSLETQDVEVLERATALYRPYYETHCLDQTKVYPGILDMLKQLVVKKLPMAIVSNKPEKYCRKIIDGLSLGSFFNVIVGSDTTSRCKPDPLPFKHACRVLQCEPAHTLVIGDGINDVLGARNIGAFSCGVLWGIGDRNVLRNAKPDYLIQKPDELIRLIELSAEESLGRAGEKAPRVKSQR